MPFGFLFLRDTQRPKQFMLIRPLVIVQVLSYQEGLTFSKLPTISKQRQYHAYQPRSISR